MKAAAALLVALASLGVVSGARHIGTKKRAFAHACHLAGAKGIINLGAGPHRGLLAREIAESPEVVMNVDIIRDGLPHFTELDIETDALPFADNEFDCAFMSHVLEHLENWQFALYEATRVADSVVIVLPHPLSPGQLNPTHKQHFSANDIDEIERIFPGVTIFY